MKTLRTFKAEQQRTDVTDWIEGTLVEFLGDSAPTLGTKIRVSIELVKADELAVDPILEVFALKEAKEAVIKFINFRRDDLRKPLTLEGVRRAVRPFSGRHRDLIASIEQSIRHGWTGLFEAKDGGGVQSREWKSSESKSKGGTW